MKYELIKVPGSNLYRIKALKPLRIAGFPDVNPGDLGGFVEGSFNLSQCDSCWIFDNAKVTGKARVIDNAVIRDFAEVTDNASVRNSAEVGGHAKISKDALILDDSVVSGQAIITDSAKVFSHASVSGRATVSGFAKIGGVAKIGGNAQVTEDAVASGEAVIDGNANVGGISQILGMVKDNAKISDVVIVSSDAKILGHSSLDGLITVPEKKILNNVSLSSDSPFINKKRSVGFPSSPLPEETSNIIIPINFYSENIVHSLLSEYLSYDELIVLKMDTPLYCNDSLRDMHNYEELLTSVIVDFIHAKGFRVAKNKLINFLFSCLIEDLSLIDLSVKLGDAFFNVLLKHSCTNIEETHAMIKNKEHISHLFFIYVLAQFVGIFLYGIEMFSSKDPDKFFENTSDKYKEFLYDIVNKAEVDLSTGVISLKSLSFAYNNEMIHAVNKICNFSFRWGTSALKSPSKSNLFAQSIKLYTP